MPTSNSPSLIRCIPKSIYSYDLNFEGDECRAELEFDYIVEQGTIKIDQNTFKVNKHGPLSGHWTLEIEGRVEASAKKSNIFTRSFEIQDSAADLSLRAISPFGRSFCIEEAGLEIATISPDLPFTSRITIQLGAKPMEVTTIAFCFWLVVLMWRRDDSS